MKIAGLVLFVESDWYLRNSGDLVDMRRFGDGTSAGKRGDHRIDGQL